MPEQALFWFVHAKGARGRFVHLAVAARTERSARAEARRLLASEYVITEVGPVNYAHAWAIDITWSTNRAVKPQSADAVGQRSESPHLTTRESVVPEATAEVCGFADERPEK